MYIDSDSFAGRPCSSVTYHELPSVKPNYVYPQWSFQPDKESPSDYVERISTLYESPTDTKQHRWVFVGPYPDKIGTLLRTLETTKDLATLSEDDQRRLIDFLLPQHKRKMNSLHSLLETLFGGGPLQNLATLTFVPQYISPTDTIQYIRNQIAFHLTQHTQETVHVDQLFLTHYRGWSEHEYNTWVDRMETATLRYYKQQPTWDQTYQLLRQLGVCDTLVQYYRKYTRTQRKSADSTSTPFRDALFHPILRPVIQWMYSHQPLDVQWTTPAGIPLFLCPNPAVYIVPPPEKRSDEQESESDTETALDADTFQWLRHNVVQQKMKMDKSLSQYIFQDMDISLFPGQFHVYILPNVYRFLMGLYKVDRPETHYKTLQATVFTKLFPRIVSYQHPPTAYDKKTQTNTVQTQVVQQYNQFMDIYFSPEIDLSYALEKQSVDIVPSNKYPCHYISIEHRLPVHKPIELLDLFNQLRLSHIIPFIKYRDVQTKEMVYKLWKEATQQKYPISSPELSKERLQQWIQNHYYDFTQYSVRQLKGSPKFLSLKYKILQTHNQVIRTGTVYTVQETVVDILYDGRVIVDVPIDYITSVGGSSALAIGQTVSFYTPISIYADVEIHPTGKWVAMLDMSAIPVPPDVIAQDDTAEYTHSLIQILVDHLDLLVHRCCELEVLHYLSTAKYTLSIPRYALKTYHPSMTMTRIDASVFHYVVSVPDTMVFSYAPLIQTIRILYPFVLLQETPLTSDSDIEYYDDSHTWKKGTIREIQMDETYVIRLVESGTEKKNVPRSRLRRVDEQDERKEIRMIYKRVSQFNMLPPIKQLVYRLQNASYSTFAILQKLMEEFNLSREQAFHYVEELTTANFDDVRKALGDTGVMITFDYVRSVMEGGQTMDIYVEDTLSSQQMEDVYTFLELFFITYASVIGQTTFSQLDTLVRSQLPSASSDVATAQHTMLDRLQASSESDTSATFDFSVDIDLDQLEFGMVEDDWGNDEDTLGDWNEPTTTTISSATTTTPTASDSLSRIQKEMRLDASMLDTLSQQKNIILDALYESDPDLFLWDPKVKDPYNKTCQSYRRYPKVITEEQKKKIDLEHPDSYRSSPEDIDCSTKANIDGFIKQHGHKKVRCKAILWGSQPDQKYWYICPRIFDMKDQVSLNISDLDFNPPRGSGLGKFESLDMSSENWRTDRKTGRDILDFNPTYKNRKPISNPSKIAMIRDETLLFLPAGYYYTYPGFLNPSTHPKNMYIPCCYKDKTNLAKEAFGLEDSYSPRTSDYVQGWGKELLAHPPRAGLLPDCMLPVLGIPKETYGSGDIRQITPSFYRRGIRQGPNAFLELLANFTGETHTSGDIVKSLLKNMKREDFIRLNGGQMVLEFTNSTLIDPFQYFLEYTVSDEIKLWKYYYEYLTQPHSWLFPKGLNLLLFQYRVENGKEQVRLMMPYFCSAVVYEDAPIALAIQYGSQTFEPIYFFQRSSSPERTMTEKTIKTPELHTIWKQYIHHIRIRKPSTLFTVAQHVGFPFNRELATMGLTDVLNHLHRVANTYPEWKPTHLVQDNLYKIIGVYVNNSNQFLIPFGVHSWEEQKLPIIDADIEKEVSLETYIRRLEELVRLSRGAVTIRPIRLFTNNHDEVVGILWNTGVYMRCHPIRRALLPKMGLSSDLSVLPGHTYYGDVDQAMNVVLPLYEQQYRQSRIQPVSTVYRQLQEYESEYQPVGVLCDRNQCMGFVCQNGVIVPFQVCRPSDLPSPNPTYAKRWSVVDYSTFVLQASPLHVVEKSAMLYRKSNQSLPSRVLRLEMDTTTKKYTHIILDVGYRIALNSNQRFYIYDIVSKENPSYMVKQFIQAMTIENSIELADEHHVRTMSQTSVEHPEQYTMLQSVKRLEYYHRMYTVCLKQIADVLTWEELAPVKRVLHWVIYHISLTMDQRMEIITPFIELLYGYVFDCRKIPTSIKSLFVYPDILYQHIVSPSSSTCSDEVLYHRVEGEKRSLRLTVPWSKKKVPRWEWLQTEYEQVVSAIQTKPICKVILWIEESTSDPIYIRLMRDLLTNTTVQRMVLNNIRVRQLREKYNVHPSLEILFTHHQLETNWLNELYKTAYRTYYRNLGLCDECDKQYAIPTESLGVGKEEELLSVIIGTRIQSSSETIQATYMGRGWIRTPIRIQSVPDTVSVVWMARTAQFPDPLSSFVF